MSNHSLPNSDDESVVSGQTTIYDEDEYRSTYLLRFTPVDDKFTLDDVKKFLDENTDFWILGVERTPKLHFHCCLLHEDTLEEMRARVRSFLFDHYPPPRPRGFGNRQYNLQLAEKELEGASYALKERTEHYFKGYSDEYIAERVADSFPKKSPSSFKVEYQLLCKQFQENPMMSERDFIKAYFTLKAKYGQQCRLQDAQGYALSNLFQRDPEEIDIYLDFKL